MSKQSKQLIRCPRCGEIHERVVYDSMNVTIDPELRSRLFSFEIFQSKCPNCGFVHASPFPFLYNNMDKQYMVYMDEYGNLLDFEQEVLKRNNNDIFPEITKKLKYVGTINVIDAMNAIVALDHDLDWRVIKICLLQYKFQYIKHCQDKGEPIGKIEMVMLAEDDNGDLVVHVDSADKEGEHNILTTKFSMEVYEAEYKRNIDRLNELNPFIFDDNMVDHFLDTFSEDHDFFEEHKDKYVLLKRSNGGVYLALIPLYLEDDLVENQLVLTADVHVERDVCVVRRFVEYNPLEISVIKDAKATIEAVYTDLHFSSLMNSNSPLGNDNLVKELVKLKKNNFNHSSKNFPTSLLRKTQLIICSMKKQDDRFHGFTEFAELMKENSENDIPPRQMQNTQKVVIDEKIYLAAYTDPFYLPSKDKIELSAVYSFVELARIIKNDPRYSGIVINQYDENIVLDINTLYGFITYNTMCSARNFKHLLKHMNEKEITYVGKLSYDLIKDVYFNKLVPKDLEKKYDLSAEKVSKKLDLGYERIRDIVYAKFW